MIHYFGMILGRKVATVGLILVSSHTAAWLGVSTPTQHPTWIQAGMMGQTYDYIERGRNGHQISLRMWKVPDWHVARVRLVHSGDWWRVIIDGRESHRGMKVPNARKITTLETVGPAQALIDGRIVTGH